MKNLSFALFLILLAIPSFAQEIRFEVRRTHSQPVSRETLVKAKTISDFRPGFPSGWIAEYVSTEITSTCNGIIKNAFGVDENLTADQVQILQTADIGADIIVEVGYKSKNPVTDNMDFHQIHFIVAMLPEVEASYPGGYDELTKYIKENTIDKISTYSSNEINAVVKFTVSENGKITNPRLSLSSDYPEIDKLLLKAITKMQKWNPAQNTDGVKMKQDFEFSIGNSGC